MNYEEMRKKLEAANQLHVLKYFDELTEAEKDALLAQVDITDFSVLSSINNKDESIHKGVITPIEALEATEISDNWNSFTTTGIRAIEDGKVGAVLLAGGMGTRLGSDDPKGMYNIGLTKDVFIFQRIIENLLEVVEQIKYIHLFIMTSDKNHDKTVTFLKEKNYFGYKEEYIHFFKQEMTPAATYEGKVYMEDKGVIACSPNGNGGWYSSMMASGMLDIVRENGIEWLNVFGVDNVLQKIADPCFVGATIERKCSVGAKVVRKNAPDEKVGVMCLEDGRPSIVEYYELNEDMMNEKNAKGDPAYNFGVILNYLLNVNELNKIVETKLPLHIVEKKINYMAEDGSLVKPESPNGYKFEKLILDMIHLMDSCLPYEVIREHEFAPIKNKTGIDSVESARALCKLNGIEL